MLRSWKDINHRLDLLKRTAIRLMRKCEVAANFTNGGLHSATRTGRITGWEVSENSRSPAWKEKSLKLGCWRIRKIKYCASQWVLGLKALTDTLVGSSLLQSKHPSLVCPPLNSPVSCYDQLANLGFRRQILDESVCDTSSSLFTLRDRKADGLKNIFSSDSQHTQEAGVILLLLHQECSCNFIKMVSHQVFLLDFLFYWHWDDRSH